jgi:cell division protein FtsB
MRLLIVLLVAALIALQWRLWVSGDGLQELRALEAEVSRQSDVNAAWAARNASLAAEVRDLKQGSDAAEERARSELGLVGEDETFYQIMLSRESDE